MTTTTTRRRTQLSDLSNSAARADLSNSAAPAGPPRCSARKTDGTACNAWPIHGSHVCRVHGGSSGRVRAAAGQRILAGKVHAAAVTLGLEIDIDPAAALLGEVHRSAGICRWLEQRIGEMDPDSLAWSVASQITGRQALGAVNTTEMRAAIHPLATLYAQERAHLLRACQVSLAAGIQERQIQLAEQLGGHVANCLEAVLDDLGLSDAQREQARIAVPQQLRLLAAGLSREGIE
jgi:hypothetical protein